MKGFRAARIAEQIRHELMDILRGEIGDPRVRSATITGVELSPDLKHAKIWVAPLQKSAQEDPLPALEHARGYLRHSLAQRLQLRYVPQLQFRSDRGFKNAERVQTLLDRIKRRSGSTRLSVLLLALFVRSLIAGSAEGPQLQRYEASASLMGSVYTVAVYGPQLGELASAVEAAFEEAHRVDNFLSNYKPESELSQINRRAPRGPVKVSAEMAHLLAKCLQYSRLSEGAFDITVGPLMRLWGFFRGEGKVPTRWAVARVRQQVGYRHIEFDAGRRTVRFRHAGVELDSGGVGKGYAVERMAEVLQKAGVQFALISAGSSSIYALGAPPDEPRGWHVRIREPHNAGGAAAELYLKDQSLSTSGSYEKFFEADGRVYSHIMDPRTGVPAQGVLSVSVLAPSALDSEAWTKAFFVNGRVWSQTHKPEGFQVFMCLEDGSCNWLGQARP